MLFVRDLENRIFNVHQYVACDELFIISGYVGPNPIQRLSALPIRTTVIYGMYGSESISQRLHDALLRLHTDRNKILYSNIPIHSKCYIWKNNGRIIYALIGSANFSTSGLSIPYRESLAETTRDTFKDLEDYLNHILDNSVPCNTVQINPVLNRSGLRNRPITNTPVQNSCDMVLYDPVTNEVQPGHGLNWGFSPRGHNRPGDACIPIRTSHIRDYPNLFPPKQTRPTRAFGGRSHRQNDSVELIWDDGTIMEALLEGSQPVDGIYYPKQISSFPSKNTLGVYIRTRLGLSPTDRVTKADLDRYGRDHITITLLQNGTYYVDFSV